MTYAYLISSDLEYTGMRILIETGYVESLFEITPDIARNLAVQAKAANERFMQLPAYRDGWTGDADTAASYYRNFKHLYNLLRKAQRE